MEYKLVRASSSILRKLLAPFVSTNYWWMTYRLPLQQYVRITYPDRVVFPRESSCLPHEMYHAMAQFSKWWGPWLLPLLAVLLPLPMLFSGRWFIERRAYLLDIQAGRYTIDTAVDALWGYAWCWPKPLMRHWFTAQIRSTK